MYNYNDGWIMKKNKTEQSPKNESINSKKELKKSLEDNVKLFKEFFQGDVTFTTRFFANQEQEKPKFCILYIDGMVDVEVANRTIIQPIVQSTLSKKFEGNLDAILEQVVLSNNAEKLCDIDELIVRIVRGESVLLMEKSNEALVIDTKGWKSRAITEPENEKVQRGPREGFVEPFLINLSMIRRKLATPDLKIENMIIGVRTKTNICICYLENIVNKQILNELLKRLGKISYDGFLGSGQIAELIEDSPYSLFDKIGGTERPDFAVEQMLEGRIIVVVDGTPSVLIVPFLFDDYFKANDDYYINFYYTSIGRILRFLSFIITILLPALYVAILTFHQEMIPSPLLFSLSAAREGIPFPTIVETLGLLIVFEILREAGMRAGVQLIQSLSILGALVLGTAAVDARIVSASVIIIVALTGLTGLMIVKIKGPAIILRFIMVLLAGFMGLYGIVFGILGTVLHLCSLRSFGIPYLLNFNSLKSEMFNNVLVRPPLWKISKRPVLISGKNKIKKGKSSN